MLRRYEELPPAELSTPQEYLELSENQRFLRCFTRFYNYYGPQSTRRIDGRYINGKPVEFPTFIASLMTQTQDRSALILRASQGEFKDINYRLFTFTFDQEAGTRAEYRLLSDKFGTNIEDSSRRPVRYMEFEFEKIAEKNPSLLPINGGLLTLTLGETDLYPNRITTNGDHTIMLADASSLILPPDTATYVGQRALRQVTAA